MFNGKLTQVIRDMTQQLVELSEKNGELLSENRNLTLSNMHQVNEISKLQSYAATLNHDKNCLIDAAEKMGFNFRPVISGHDKFWVDHGVDIAAAIIKPALASLSIPDYAEAESDPKLKGVMASLNDNHRYVHASAHAKSILIKPAE